MKEKKFEFSYEVYDDIKELNKPDAELLSKARHSTAGAYAPYSRFHVGAVARTVDGDLITGTNQENASFPVGICAERSLLASAAALFPNSAIETMAISYDNKNDGTKSDRPISPCGMCRQALQEYEVRGKRPLRLILGGQSGKIIVVSSTSQLLPFAFTPDELV
ncbi:MAG: cytidine deaminase [Chitinophagaceae bacterium]|nr:cytidine deaminase [Chitinophagaceae bacterium]